MVKSEKRGARSEEKGDVSAEALSLARAVDRVCKRPGRYVVVIEVGEKGRGGWTAEIGRVELLQGLESV